MNLRSFFIKLTSWEYWPWQLVYLPIWFYALGIAIRARSPFFFSASNPGIENGGLLAESKSAILKKIPAEFTPKTLLIEKPEPQNILRGMEQLGLSFPIILKPDFGERGRGVEKINHEEELPSYCREVQIPVIIQEFIDYPLEVGVFYYRHPNRQFGTISSVVLKEMLSITGDGKSSVETLMTQNPRAFLQLERLKEAQHDLMTTVVPKGEKLLLESIGNHCRGTKFLNGNHLINKVLHARFDQIALQIEGFNYGRFDLRVPSLEDLYAGKNIKIMELNGAKAEPAHIYHPGYSLVQAYKDLFAHWKVMGDISIANHQNGVPYTTFRKGIASLIEYQQLSKM
ncbi:hypothetical protein [Persicobacter diffluens]|uniref:D-alanine--D-alanine ligase n=1 Tax=Persicobacter diffluens TaxID=981 RepID=A0AAN5AN09_9BACT|nr:D-alanine--D-alanine ligase [Persicobacter diffluens]